MKVDVTFTAKLAFAKDLLILKPLDRHVRVEVRKATCWKTFWLQEEKGKEKTNGKWKKRREDMEVIWAFKYTRIP